MTFDVIAILGYSLFKLASLLTGLISVFMGYRLFLAGIWGEPSQFVANVGKNRLLLKSAAPGLFFALFGTCVIAVTLWIGFNVQLPDAGLDNGIIQGDSPADKPQLPIL
jgi:hypothetical protein